MKTSDIVVALQAERRRKQAEVEALDRAIGLLEPLLRARSTSGQHDKAAKTGMLHRAMDRHLATVHEQPAVAKTTRTRKGPHWTQKPENRHKMMANIRRATVASHPVNGRKKKAPQDGSTLRVALDILSSSDRPLRGAEIARMALDRGWYTSSAHPDNLMDVTLRQQGRKLGALHTAEGWTFKPQQEVVHG